MEFFLLLISFIIHAVTFVIIKHLKTKVDQPAVAQEEIIQQKKEIEDLLAVYLLEIREENEKVIASLANNKGTQMSGESSNNVVIDKVKDQEITDKEPERSSNRKPLKDYQPPVDNSEPDRVEQSFAAQILSMYNQGNSIETIARKLDRGKTEIELLVKFQQKNR